MCSPLPSRSAPPQTRIVLSRTLEQTNEKSLKTSEEIHQNLTPWLVLNVVNGSVETELLTSLGDPIALRSSRRCWWSLWLLLIVMVVIRLVTNMMVGIMVTKMMVVISLVTNMMVVTMVTKMMLAMETKGHHYFGYRDGNHRNRVFGDSDYNEMMNTKFWGRC